VNHLVVGTFNLTDVVDALFFIGSHLVALNQSGKLGVWHAMSQNWQVQVQCVPRNVTILFFE